MQKARRFVCSTVSQSSPSNGTIKTKKKGRTSSAAGDSLAVSRTAGDALEPKSKPRHKCNVRELSGNLKNSKKAAKPCRAPKPNSGSLQNAVVLAPFYTLKRCYQNKLVDLYSYEKMKKTNQKSKMAKKRNMSFEYDIVELKPLLGQPIKKEVKTTKKQRRKSRSVSYCQCKKSPAKDEKEVGESSLKQRRMTSSREPLAAGAPCFSGLKVKRRKMNHEVVTPMILKAQPIPGVDFRGPGEPLNLPEGKLSSSVVSCQSKCESWETFSNSLSCKEEHMQGSLAISTTSFDSYLEHFDKGCWDSSEPRRKDSGRLGNRKDQERMDADFLPKPGAKQLILHVDRKNSDGDIVDFMDREPQTQVIPSVDSDQNWQPLLRQSRSKRKKQESAQAAGYYLRSVSSSKEKDEMEGNRTFLSANRQECSSSCGNCVLDRNRVLQIEVGTQVNGSGAEAQGPFFSSLKNNQQGSTPAYGVTAPGEETREEAYLRSPSEQRAQSPAQEPDGNPEPPGESPHLPQSDAAQGQPEGVAGQRLETVPGILGEHSDLASGDLAPDLHERLEGPAGSRQLQDKDSSYIFGARNNASGLGESCEFSFGLKWVFSDDED